MPPVQDDACCPFLSNSSAATLRGPADAAAAPGELELLVALPSFSPGPGLAVVAPEPDLAIVAPEHPDPGFEELFQPQPPGEPVQRTLSRSLGARELSNGSLPVSSVSCCPRGSRSGMRDVTCQSRSSREARCPRASDSEEASSQDQVDEDRQYSGTGTEEDEESSDTLGPLPGSPRMAAQSRGRSRGCGRRAVQFKRERRQPPGRRQPVQFEGEEDEEEGEGSGEAEAGTGGCGGRRSSSIAGACPAALQCLPPPRRSRCLPTEKLQRVLEEGDLAEEEEEKERAPGGVDLMLVLPVGPQPGDDQPLAKAGPDHSNPAPGSAAWFLRQIVCDDEVFTANSKRQQVRGRASMLPGGARRNSGLPQYFRPSVVLEYPLMKLCYSQALQEAKTKGELRERVVELLLRYLISAKCCFQVRAFLGCDGGHLFLGVYADELVLRGHADALGHQVQLDRNVARGLLRGSFTRAELHPAYVRYDLEEENKFRSLHGHTPFMSYFDTFSEADGGSIFRSVDRMRIMERVISRVFNLDDMLEHGFLTARYACHNSLQQRALARTWATARLLHSPSVPLGAIRDYLGEAVTFRICFLSFLTRASLPVAALALLAGAVPEWLSGKTALSMVMCLVLGVWGSAFFKLWLRAEQHWIMAWGMEGFKTREATRSRFVGAWGVSVIDRYTIVKVAPWSRQFYRRAFTCLVTCLFNLLLVGLVVALFSYRQRLLKAGDTRMAQAVYYLNAFQMLFWDTVWSYIAISLTDFDNYATDTEYNERVIQRIFVTRFINSFASLIYIAFLKQFMETCDDGHGCTTELAKQLRVLFGTSIARSVFRPAFSYAWFRVVDMNKLRRAKRRQRLSGYSAVQERCQQSSLEIQASMPENSLSEDVEDVMDLLIELGFVMFFGCVAPEIIWIFCVSNLIRIRAWGWKLLFAVQRPFPLSAAGLGTLNKVVNLMSASSVWCNILLCLMLNFVYYRSSQTHVILWLKEMVGTTSDSGSHGSVNWKSLLAVFLILERLIFWFRGLIDISILHNVVGVELEEKRRDAMITAYYKLIIEDAKVEDDQAMNETTVEALSADGFESPGEPPVREWYPISVEKILRACRQVRPESEPLVPPFTPRDPGFEFPWDEQEEGEDGADLSPPDSPRS